MERRKCLIKSLKNELWNFMVDTRAYFTHFIIDRSINVSLRTGFLLGKARSEHATFCGPARDTVLTNRQTEKLNFDTNYITMTFDYSPSTCITVRLTSVLIEVKTVASLSGVPEAM